MRDSARVHLFTRNGERSGPEAWQAVVGSVERLRQPQHLLRQLFELILEFGNSGLQRGVLGLEFGNALVAPETGPVDHARAVLR